MKQLLLLLTLLLAAPAVYAQKPKEAPVAPPVDADTKKIAYTGVIEVPETSKSELYARGKVWFATNFKSAQNVIQADDKEAGLLVGKAWQQAYVTVMLLPVAEKLWYSVQLSFKDGKYRYNITDLQFESEPSKYNYNPSPTAAETFIQLKKDGTMRDLSVKYARSLDEAMKSTIASIITSMSKPAAGSKDW